MQSHLHRSLDATSISASQRQQKAQTPTPESSLDTAQADAKYPPHHNAQDHPIAKKTKAASLSFFEFWPTWLVYLPVMLQWPVLALRYRSLTLPLLANPSVTIAAMVGVPKSELMDQSSGACRAAFLDWQRFVVSELNTGDQASDWIKSCHDKGIALPFVCKPDIGCRGSGVKLIHNQLQLAKTIASYPAHTALLIQTLASYEPEAGVFYVRMPGEQGYVASLAIKESPSVQGDGVHTLAELIAQDDRAGQLQHLYYQRHKERWEQVIEKGQVIRLVFSASHCRGAVFSDARDHITPELTDSMNKIMAGLPNFHYGRLDIKYADLEKLKQGQSIEIIEINGASAESIHIWDKNASLIDAMATLMWQYRTLYKIGDYYRAKGYKTPGLAKLVKHYLIEKRLQKYYPTTD